MSEMIDVEEICDDELFEGFTKWGGYETPTMCFYKMFRINTKKSPTKKDYFKVKCMRYSFTYLD